MAKVYYEKDADLDALAGKTVAVIGYGSQGRAQALNLRDSGVNVIIGLRKGGSWEKAEADGQQVFEVSEACAKADYVQVLVPDELQKDIYSSHIKEHMSKGKVLGFSHGFNIHFGLIIPPEGVDIVMVAPKSPGKRVRGTYEDGFGVPGLLAVHRDSSGNAKGMGLAYAKAIGCTRAGVLETSFKDETESDLFGEQVDLCGGVTELIKASFDTLVEGGYPPEMAYFETLHELKLITDLIYDGGLSGMWDSVSNTATYGGLTRGKRIITESTRQEMKRILEEIQDGRFAKEWLSENERGLPNFKRLVEEDSSHPIEKVGVELRKMMERNDEK